MDCQIILTCKWTKMMSDSDEPLLLSLDTPDDPEAPENILHEIQNRQNNIKERIISLKAVTETVKNKIATERELWLRELGETIKLEKQLKEEQKTAQSLTEFQEDEYKRKLEVFKDFLFFSQTSDNLKKILRENSYQRWLTDLSEECSLELDKIGRSLTALKPLKKIVSRWNVQSETDSGISENRGSFEAENEIDMLDRVHQYYG